MPKTRILRRPPQGQACECEHEHHFTEALLAPGLVAHHYGATCRQVSPALTLASVWLLCPDCTRYCHPAITLTEAP